MKSIFITLLFSILILACSNNEETTDEIIETAAIETTETENTFYGETVNGEKVDLWKEFDPKGNLLTAKFYAKNDNVYDIDINDFNMIDTSIVLGDIRYKTAFPANWVVDSLQKESKKILIYKEDSILNYFPRISYKVEERKDADFQIYIDRQINTTVENTTNLEDETNVNDIAQGYWEWVYTAIFENDIKHYVHQLTYATPNSILTIRCDAEAEFFFYYEDVFFEVLASISVEYLDGSKSI